MRDYIHAGLSPPVILASQGSDPYSLNRLIKGYSDGSQWGLDVAWAILGLMLIAALIRLTFDKM